MSSNFVPNEDNDLHSFASFRKEFHRTAPSYIKLFFILVVRGCGKCRVIELFRRSYFVTSHFFVKSFVRDFGPKLFNNLNISFV